MGILNFFSVSVALIQHKRKSALCFANSHCWRLYLKSYQRLVVLEQKRRSESHGGSDCPKWPFLPHQDIGEPHSAFSSAWVNSDLNLLLSRKIFDQRDGSSALGEFSSMEVGFTGLWIRMQESLDKEEGEKTKPEAFWKCPCQWQETWVPAITPRLLKHFPWHSRASKEAKPRGAWGVWRNRVRCL